MFCSGIFMTYVCSVAQAYMWMGVDLPENVFVLFWGIIVYVIFTCRLCNIHSNKGLFFWVLSSLFEVFTKQCESDLDCQSLPKFIFSYRWCSLSFHDMMSVSDFFFWPFCKCNDKSFFVPNLSVLFIALLILKKVVFLTSVLNFLQIILHFPLAPSETQLGSWSVL